MSEAYTEQDLVEQLVSAITNNDKEFSFDHQQIREALQEYGLSHIRSYTSEARAGMREACADCSLSFVAAGKEAQQPDFQMAIAAKIRNVPDAAADEAIERIKREAEILGRKFMYHLWEQAFRTAADPEEEERGFIAARAALSGKETSQ